jgi:hypothetical protein
MAIEIEYVSLPKKKRVPRFLTSDTMLSVERKLRSRPRHPRSKVISTEEIMRVEERMRRQRLVRSVEES